MEGVDKVVWNSFCILDKGICHYFGDFYFDTYYLFAAWAFACFLF